MIKQKIMRSTVAYDPKLKALIVPWAHRYHTWVGFAYKFDDESQPDRLVYFVPAGGLMQYHVHMTPLSIVVEGGHTILSYETPPDPETDPEVTSFNIS